MDRRQFIAKAGLGAAGVAAGASALAAPAIAQSSPEVRWRMTSAFTKALDTIYGTGEAFTRAVAEATDGKFQIQSFATTEIVPTAGIVDAVQDGTVEMGHTASYYYFGKDPTFALGTAVPFGLNSRMLNAWMYFGGAMDLLNEFYAKYNIYGLPGGNTGAQMGGWFRKEINSVADINGLKMRIAGLGGIVMAKLGLVPQTLAVPEIYPSLEKGAIDATEFVGPYDDEKLGFDKVAKYYYYPGWWEGGAMLHFFINRDAWAKLPPSYQAIVKTAASEANVMMQARYDAVNPPAIRRLAAKGVQVRPFSADILRACFEASKEVYAELNAKSPDFKKVYDSMVAFRGEEYLWFQLADGTFDNFMYAQQRAGAL
ncbi:MAG TPA: TRAP transporter substrate-binding protein [Bauldia sp.]|nr:TRAP transporter substrate-binding protein [Bauldia sp.]